MKRIVSILFYPFINFRDKNKNPWKDDMNVIIKKENKTLIDIT